MKEKTSHFVFFTLPAAMNLSLKRTKFESIKSNLHKFITLINNVQFLFKFRIITHCQLLMNAKKYLKTQLKISYTPIQ